VKYKIKNKTQDLTRAFLLEVKESQEAKSGQLIANQIEHFVIVI